MRDGVVRRGIKRFLLWNFYLDLWATRLRARLRGDKPYLLGGNCQLCARCCEAPSLRVGWLLSHVGALRKGLVAFESLVNGFELTQWDRPTETLTFRCSHFDWETRRCDSYDSRPGMCRDYPRLLLYQPNPELLSGCGYRPVARNAAQMRLELAKRNLTPEQMRTLSERLFLDE
jgi:Fe-S-cluster containining protein